MQFTYSQALSMRRIPEVLKMPPTIPRSLVIKGVKSLCLYDMLADIGLNSYFINIPAVPWFPPLWSTDRF